MEEIGIHQKGEKEIHPKISKAQDLEKSGLSKYFQNWEIWEFKFGSSRVHLQNLMKVN